MSHRGGGGGSETLSAIGKIEQGKESAIEAEVRAARERAVIPIEIRMKQFRDMLQEKEVSHESLLRACCDVIALCFVQRGQSLSRVVIVVSWRY